MKKILLVDDSMTTLFMEEMILDGRYDVALAKDGEEALDKALAEAPDLILLDVVMPRMNGFDVLAALRAREETREVPIIMVTTRGEETNVEQGFARGCTDYVTKPIDATELLTKVKAYLGEI